VPPEIHHNRRHCRTCQQSTWYSATGQDFDKRLYLKGYTAKRLTHGFPEKNWTKCGVNKLLKKLRDIRTVDRQPGSADRTVPTLKKACVETVNDLVSSQEDKPQTHRTVREISRETDIHRCTQNAICLLFLPYLLNICKKFEFLISQGSVQTCLR